MKRRGGLAGTITGIIGALIGIGIFLAILAQFGGSFGELFRWILDLAWGVITSVRDSLVTWGVFSEIF